MRDNSIKMDLANPGGFSPETLEAMNDAVTGRKLSKVYRIAQAAMAALDEEQ